MAQALRFTEIGVLLAQLVAMALGKDTGGIRFVGLATGVLRVIMRLLRLEYVVSWIDEHAE